MDGMTFHPTTLSISVNWMVMKRAHCWRRQVIALYVHELVHLWQWLVTYRQDTDKWNAAPDPEHVPNLVQGMLLRMLLVPGKLSKGEIRS